jgi:Cu(I)/Ag(I) efflux system membrane fusion protein
MKTYLITLMALFLSTVNIQAQEEKEHGHDDHLSILISEYMDFKNALVADDFEKAHKHISKFSEEVKSNNEMNEHKEHQKKHDMHHAKMLAAVETATASKNIEELRSSLLLITEELVKAVENQGYDKSALYVQFCPMANNRQGAKWLSESEKIANPYFGQKMHKCGTTVKTIN